MPYEEGASLYFGCRVEAGPFFAGEHGFLPRMDTNFGTLICAHLTLIFVAGCGHFDVSKVRTGIYVTHTFITPQGGILILLTAAPLSSLIEFLNAQ